MGTIFVDTLEPEGGTTTLTVGETGQNTVVGGNTIKLNTLKDAGGNTLFTSDGSGNLSSVNSGFGAAKTLISSQTADDSASITFTSGISTTFTTYIFSYYTLAPETQSAHWQFQCSTDGGSNYNTTLTSTAFYAWHTEADTDAGITYWASGQQSEGTAYQWLDTYIDDTAPACGAGQLTIYNLASTTYVKNFYSNGVRRPFDGNLANEYFAGYFNTTSAINAVSFKFSTGNITTGTVKMWGLK